MLLPMLFLELSLDGNPSERVVIKLHRENDNPHAAQQISKPIFTDEKYAFDRGVTAVELFYSSRLELDPSEEASDHIHHDLCSKVPEAYFWQGGMRNESILVVFTHMHFLNRCCPVYGYVVEGNETFFKIRRSAEVVEITGCGNVSDEENNRLTQAQAAEAKKNNYWKRQMDQQLGLVESDEDTVMGSDDGESKANKKRIVSSESDRPEPNRNPKRKFSSYSGPEPDKGEKKAPSRFRLTHLPPGAPWPWQPGYAEHPEVIKSRKALEEFTAECAKRRAEQTLKPRPPLQPWQRNCPYNFTVEQDFSRTPNVPIYVMLPLGIINNECEVVGPDHLLLSQLETLKKSVNLDGVTVDVCWGIVEANNPEEYNWEGYKRLFGMLLASDLKIKVVMSFHECRGVDGVHIPLPKWITEIGKENPDIYFTDNNGNRNLECLTWGIDNEPVLRGRTALQVYSDFMRSFQTELDKLFHNRSIAKIQIGLGASGELRYPSFGPPNHASAISEFQCCDKYLRKSLEKAKGDSSLVDNNNSQPQETENSSFIFKRCSQYLIEHGDMVLSKAKSFFQEPGCLSVKVSGMHWWVEPDDSSAKAAELTAGFGDGYAPLISMLKKHGVSLDFTCPELTTLNTKQIFDPKGLASKVLNGAWNSRVQVSSENAAQKCYYDTEGYNKILELAKPRNVKHRRRHLAEFTYRRFNQALLEPNNLKEFQQFVKRMHGVAAAGED